jgi:hypothetical protein
LYTPVLPLAVQEAGPTITFLVLHSAREAKDVSLHVVYGVVSLGSIFFGTVWAVFTLSGR